MLSTKLFRGIDFFIDCQVSAEINDRKDDEVSSSSTASSSSSSSGMDKRAERMKRLKELHLRRVGI